MKKQPSPRWCMERTLLLKNHMLSALGDYRLNLITDEAIIGFRNDLYGRNWQVLLDYTHLTLLFK